MSKRFFYHYYKQYNCMSVHYNHTCSRVDDVHCSVKTETKWNKTQPKLVIRGFASQVRIIKKNKRVIAYIL